MKKSSQAEKIKKEVEKLLQSPEGILTLLAGSLAISDFDDIDTAIAEAQKAYLGNKTYFAQLIKRAQP
ncbi:MAG: hypothetical protein QNL04_10220 [SAR324 cluster bacterium]|nr:hypothetical protein [SAR324 cluster bacterium]